jgi:hypothetical protein
MTWRQLAYPVARGRGCMSVVIRPSLTIADIVSIVTNLRGSVFTGRRYTGKPLSGADKG